MKSISKGKAWVSLLVLLSLFIIISYFSYSPEPRQFPNYAVESPSPTGVKALYTYLSAEQKVKKWSHSPNLLGSINEKQLLIMAEPSFTLRSEEMKAYANYMEKGHAILLLKKNPNDFFSLKTAPYPIRELSDDAKTIKSHDEKMYHGEISSTFRLQANKEDTILLSDEGGIIALKRPFGKGQLIVSTAPEWITNEKITSYDHTVLLFSLLNDVQPNAILFDEYIHGGENAANWKELYPKWFLVIMLQGLIILILFLWQKGKRFGPIYKPREETVRFSDERIRALAFWYLRSKRYHDSLMIQSDYVKLLMQEKWGIPYKKQWLDSADLVIRKWRSIPKSEIQAFLQGISSIVSAEKMTRQEYLYWSIKLDRLRKEVEKK